MKRKLLSLFIVVLPLLVMGQQKEFSHWSVVGGVGMNRFDGDIYHNDFNPAWNLSLEYALTRVWGISLNYTGLPFTGPITDGKWALHRYTFKTMSNDVDLDLTVNLTRLIFPELRTKWHVNSSVGLGAAFMKFNSITPYANSDMDFVTPVAFNAGEQAEVEYTKNGKRSTMLGVFPVSLSVEYNFTNSLALGAKMDYRSYNDDNVEGFNYIDYGNGTSWMRKAYRGVTNDHTEVGTIYLRYKIDAINKDHLRNLSTSEFAKNDDLKKLKGDLDGLKNKVKDVNDKVDGIAPRVDKVEKTLSNTGPDTDGDGVPDHRDLEPNTPPNTPVDFWGRTLKLPQESLNSDDIPAVYFDFDRTELDDEALTTIRKVSAKMKANPELMVEVRGFCDYMGNNPYNDKLSQRRSDKVKKEMIKTWGIDGKRIIANGKGRILSPSSKYRPNRRCDFYFSK